MFDVSSLFIVLVVTNLVLAGSLWVGAGRSHRDGLGHWMFALLLQALAFALYAARNEVPDWLGIAAANGLLAGSLSLTAGAMAAFRRIEVPHIVHGVFGLAAAFASAALLDDIAGRSLVQGLLCGAAMVAAAALIWRPQPDVSTAARGLFVFGFLAGAASFFARSVAMFVEPASAAVINDTSVFQAISLLVGYSVILMASVSFLLMHKERADHVARQLASKDPLTGAYNRRTFIDLAEKELARARRFDTPMSLILLDIDHFKRINDSYGHLVGDHVLQRFADLVRGQMRAEDVLVRYGGEEFCLLLPDIPGPGAVTLAGRIRTAVCKEPLLVDGIEIALTTSAGVAARIDEGPEGLDRLIGRADEALYMAKNRGRNRVAAVSLGQSRIA
jgi:diguanylate cyclase (GGDEF)-like protein